MAIKTAKELAESCVDVAKNHKTLYVMGCFGSPMTSGNKARYTNNHDYNRKAARTKKIKAASADTFGFDCVNLIKGLLWGWSGNASKTYGGASYQVHGVPDISANQMIQVCKGVTTDFSTIEVGEAVWMAGHIGVYIGNGLCVECTPKWADGVQITAVGNVPHPAGYNVRTWTKHGKLPYVSYAQAEPAPAPTTEKGKVDHAQSYSKAKAGTYRVKASSGLHLRTGASKNKDSIEIMKTGSKVNCYGYYTGAWLLVVSASGKTGFCHSGYLAKV